MRIVIADDIAIECTVDDAVEIIQRMAARRDSAAAALPIKGSTSPRPAMRPKKSTAAHGKKVSGNRGLRDNIVAVMSTASAERQFRAADVCQALLDAGLADEKRLPDKVSVALAQELYSKTPSWKKVSTGLYELTGQ